LAPFSIVNEAGKTIGELGGPRISGSVLKEFIYRGRQYRVTGLDPKRKRCYAGGDVGTTQALQKKQQRL
jgi:hypothetical protein